MKIRIYFLIALLTCLFVESATTYPIDGYGDTNIRRLDYLGMVVDGELKGTMPYPGQLKASYEIQLNLADSVGKTLTSIPAPDPILQSAIDKLFPRYNENYSLSVLDITPGRPVRYASRKENAQYQPGSVGKIAVLNAFFTELQKIYPNSFKDRQDLMCTKEVRAGQWALYDSHTVPVFNTRNNTLNKRTVQSSDVFLLYEWLDFMMSVSNNGAATVCWREAMLMRVFGQKYPTLTEKEAEEYFRTTPRAELADLAISVVNDPLRTLGIGHEEWRLGTLFTKGGSNYVPPKGGSTGTTLGLMKFLVLLERGQVVDEASSLEMKKLMYMTDRRIRYAAAPSLREAAVYFKSGSLYQCSPEEGYACEKYKGNRNNYMNSVAIVEHYDCTTYLVVLMSNVRKRNSASDHMALAAAIDKIIKK
jgi:hypothetical protein